MSLQSIGAMFTSRSNIIPSTSSMRASGSADQQRLFTGSLPSGYSWQECFERLHSNLLQRIPDPPPIGELSFQLNHSHLMSMGQGTLWGRPLDHSHLAEGLIDVDRTPMEQS